MLNQIDKLAKCKYQDNLETLQWFKRYVDSRGHKEYDKRPKSHDNRAPINGNRISAPNIMPQQPTIKPPKKLVKMPEKQTTHTKVGKIDVEDSKPETRTLDSFEEVKKFREIQKIIDDNSGISALDKYFKIVEIVYRSQQPPAPYPEEESLLLSPQGDQPDLE